MDLGLSGKVAWVTAASSGLGRAAATSLAREGAVVAISARGEERLSRVASEIGSLTGARCVAFPLDITDPEAIAMVATEIADTLGPVDVLVSNAGGPPPGTFDALDDSALQGAYELLVASAWRLAQAVVPSMRERGGGCLVFLTSSSAKEVIDGLTLSNVFRVSVAALAKTLSRELGPYGIRTVCIAPGRVQTPRIEVLEQAAASARGIGVEQVRAQAIERIPLGRYGRPEEIGDVVSFASSERASYLTGATLLVDGGASVTVLA